MSEAKTERPLCIWCKKNYDEGTAEKCVECQQVFCADCMRTVECSDCGRRICTYCSLCCSECGNAFCVWSETRSLQCGKLKTHNVYELECKPCREIRHARKAERAQGSK